jgi:organic radical activating enzyme
MNILGTQFTLEHNSLDIYIAGCSGNPHCSGCHNPESWDFNQGTLYDEKFRDEIKNKITEFDNMIDNIMIFGGEPLDQNKEDLLVFLKDMKKIKKTIWLFTRYQEFEVDKDFLKYIDYLKVGRYVDKLKVEKNEWFGINLASSNQKILKVSRVRHLSGYTKQFVNKLIFYKDYIGIEVENRKKGMIKEAKVSYKDFHKINNMKFCLTNQMYARSIVNGGMHNLIVGETPKNLVIDHINRDRLDNRSENLRMTSFTVNGYNKGKQSNNTSGVVGVSYDKERNKWAAHIKLDGNKKFLGRFDSLEDARLRREEAEIEYFGEKIERSFDKNTVFEKR